MARSRRQRGQAAFSLFAFQDIITAVTGIIVLITLILALELLHRETTAAAVAPMQPAITSQQVSELDEEIRSLKVSLAANQAILQEAASLPAEEIVNLRRHSQEQLDRLQRQLAHRKQELQQSFEKRKRAETSQIANAAERKAHLNEQRRKLREAIQELSDSNQVIYNTNPNASKRAWLVDLQSDVIRVGRPRQADRATAFRARGQGQRVADLLRWARQRDRQNEYFVLLVHPGAIKVYREVRAKLQADGYQLGYDLLPEGMNALTSTETKKAGS